MAVMVVIPTIIVIVVALVVIGIFNGLIARKKQVESVFSTVDVMLKKRYDLIPNLVETVKEMVSRTAFKTCSFEPCGIVMRLRLRKTP